MPNPTDDQIDDNLVHDRTDGNLVHVQAIVSAADGAPWVQLNWRNLYGQMTPDEARQHALSILDAANAAETDAGVLRFVRQAGGDLVTVCALGTARGAQYAPWLLRLTLAPLVLVSLDRDHAGDEAAAWWLQVLGPRAVRWLPDPGFKDPNAMLQALGDTGLRAWVLAGLHTVDSGPWSVDSEQSLSVSSPTTNHQPLTTDTDPCAICGAPFDRYDPNGRPLCAVHYAAYEQAEADWAQLGQRTTGAERETRNDEQSDSSLIAPRSSLPAKLPELFPIPHRTKPQRCNCGMEFYWVVVNNKPIPVSVNTDLHPDCVAPTRDTPGAGIRHHIDCPLRHEYRTRKPSALDHPLDPQPQPATTEAA